MNHSIAINGRTFFTAQVVDSYKNEIYDMTVIFMDRQDDLPPVLVDFYYGEPDMAVSMQYVRNYLMKSTRNNVWVDFLEDIRSIVEAYRITNEDVLDGATNEKVERVLHVLKKTLDTEAYL